jgi:hypothetical protein
MHLMLIIESSIDPSPATSWGRALPHGFEWRCTRRWGPRWRRSSHWATVEEILEPKTSGTMAGSESAMHMQTICVFKYKNNYITIIKLYTICMYI